MSFVLVDPNPDPAKMLTDQEKAKIANSGGLCPDCDEGELVEGPKAGNSQPNVKCEHCGQEFWLSFFGTVVIFGGRIDRDEPGLYTGRPISLRYRSLPST